MRYRRIVLVCLILSCVLVLSCQKVQPTPPSTLKFEKIKYLDAIPNEFGRMVGVTVTSAYPNMAQLWFEKPDKTIMVVKVDWQSGYISEEVLVIPRR